MPPPTDTAAASEPVRLDHQFSLDQDALASSLTVMAGAPSLLHRLQRGRPVSVAVLGASVAQSGGCYDRAKRCHDWSRGAKRGFIVRFMELLNRTWPQAHSLKNSATDATPPQMLLDCLYSLVPPSPHLIVLEFGSMGRHVEPVRTELLVRLLLRLPSNPSLVFVTVREWCASSHLGFGHEVPSYGRNQTTRHSQAEAFFEAMCHRYGQSCLSYFRACERGYYAEPQEPNFTRKAIGRDCLHPEKGTHGTAYMTDMLVHWLRQAMLRNDPVTVGRVATSTVAGLPPPLMRSDNLNTAKAALHARSDRCYRFGVPGTTGLQSKSQQKFESVPWRTAHCSSLTQPLERCMDPGPTECPTQTSMRNFQPRGWVYCSRALVDTGDGQLRSSKLSPGTTARVPGATMEFALDTSSQISSRAGGRGVQSLTSRPPLHASVEHVQMRLTYLQSYERHGIVQLTCVRGCTCAEQRIDAHTPPASGRRNESVFAQQKFAVAGRTRRCELRLQLLEETSSGGHMFKVKDLSLGSNDAALLEDAGMATFTTGGLR